MPSSSTTTTQRRRCCSSGSGSNLDQLGMPVPVMLETISATLRSFWRPVDEQCKLPTGAEKAAWLAAYIQESWEELHRPCAREVVDRAIEYCDDRAAAFDPARAVLVHGDAHGWNTLQAGPGAFKFVDPEGLRSEPEHDLSVVIARVQPTAPRRRHAPSRP